MLAEKRDDDLSLPEPAEMSPCSISLTIAQAIELQSYLIEDLDNLDILLQTGVTPQIEKMLGEYQAGCNQLVDRINDVFNTTTIVI